MLLHSRLRLLGGLREDLKDLGERTQGDFKPWGSELDWLIQPNREMGLHKCQLADLQACGLAQLSRCLTALRREKQGMGNLAKKAEQCKAEDVRRLRLVTFLILHLDLGSRLTAMSKFQIA